MRLGEKARLREHWEEGRQDHEVTQRYGEKEDEHIMLKKTLRHLVECR